MKKSIFLFLALFFVITSNDSQAAGSGGPRMAHRFGISAGLIAHPYPSMWGVNVGYNITDWIRVNGSYGSISLSDPTISINATTFAATAEVFIIPGWAVSPFAVVGYSQISATISGVGSLSALGGITGSSGTAVIGGGLDWQARFGMNFGVKYVMGLVTGATGLPGGYIGWYF